MIINGMFNSRLFLDCLWLGMISIACILQVSAQDSVSDNPDLFQVNYITIAVETGDPIEEDGGTLFCGSGDQIGEVFSGEELWFLDFQNNKITIYYEEDEFSEPIVGTFDPELKTFEIVIIGEFEPVEENPSFVSKEDFSIIGSFGPNGFNTATAIVIETSSTGWDADERTVTCSSTYSMTASRVNSPFLMRWPNGDKIAETTFLINGISINTDSSGILDPTGIPELRNSEFSEDFIQLERDGQNVLFSLGLVDLDSAKENGFYEIDLFNMTFLWPTGEPVSGRLFTINGFSRESDVTGKVDLNNIALTRFDPSGNDFVNLRISGTSFDIPIERLELAGLTKDGVHVLELCEWASNTTNIFVDYRREYLDALIIESELRKFLEVEYVIERRFEFGPWYVRPQTELSTAIETLSKIIKAFDPSTWLGRFVSAFCKFGIGGERGTVCSFATSSSKLRFLQKNGAQYLAFEITRLFIENSEDAFNNEEDAVKAVNNLLSHVYTNWKTFQPIYNELRKIQPELAAFWNDVVPSLIFVRGKSRDSANCISDSDYDALYIPPQLLKELTEPDLNVVRVIDADGVIYLPDGSLYVLPPTPDDSPVSTSLPEKHEDLEMKYEWILVTSEGIVDLGEGEFYTIDSFNETDEGEYIRAQSNSDGEVLEIQSFGVYRQNEQLALPTVTFPAEIVVAFEGTSFAYAPEVNSEGVTNFTWQKGNLELEGINDSGIYIVGLSDMDEGTYSVGLENPAGVSQHEVFELRVIGNPLEGIELDSSEVVLTIATEEGMIYQVEQSGDLNNWLSLGAPMSGDGANRQVRLGGELLEGAFLRIVVEGE